MCVQTWERWREDIEREDMRFEPAPEYRVFPERGDSLKPYQAAVLAAEESRPLLREFAPDAVIADILTTAAPLAAELEGRRWATLVPHVLPTPEPGFPPYSIGARLPRTRVGSLLWRSLDPVVRIGVERGRDELNGARERLGLRPLPHTHNGISRELAIIATFPQLEYPRASWAPWSRVTGPLLFEQPFAEVELPAGDAPLVLVAPSTSQDPDARMLHAALEGLEGEPVRVIATTNRRGDPLPPAPANARVVDWLSYAHTMPHCSAVICHAGHGTVARALSCGVPLVAAPAAGDMAENSARIAWAGAGVSLPRRLVTPRGVRLALRRVLGEPRFAGTARRLGDWAQRNPGDEAAAVAVEAFAAR